LLRTVVRTEQYYALCVEGENGDPEIALLHLEENEDGTVLGIAVYTSPDGAVQREDLEKNEESTTVRKVGRQRLLDTIQRSVPSSVFIDGQKVASSVFTAILKDALGIPIRHLGLTRRPGSPDQGTPVS
jgi:hypothetical protein